MRHSTDGDIEGRRNPELLDRPVVAVQIRRGECRKNGRTLPVSSSAYGRRISAASLYQGRKHRGGHLLSNFSIERACPCCAQAFHSGLAVVAGFCLGTKRFMLAVAAVENRDLPGISGKTDVEPDIGPLR